MLGQAQPLKFPEEPVDSARLIGRPLSSSWRDVPFFGALRPIEADLDSLDTRAHDPKRGDRTPFFYL